MADDDVKEEEEGGVAKEGTLSDGVLDAFEETAPADPLLEDETPVKEEEDEELPDYDPEEWQ